MALKTTLGTTIWLEAYLVQLISDNWICSIASDCLISLEDHPSIHCTCAPLCPALVIQAGGRYGSQLGGTRGESGPSAYRNSSPSVRSSSMCPGGWVNESLLGLQPFFGPLSLGLIPLKEMMEGRLVCKCGFYLSRLTLSLSGTPVHGQQDPKTSIGSHRRTTPVPTVHSSGRVLLTWRWGGEGVRAKSLHCVWLSVTL